MNREDVRRMEEILEEMHGPIAPYRPRPQTTGFVYFVQNATGHVKIGWSNDPMRRLISLQTAHSEKLTLLGVVRAKRSLERSLQARFAEYRVLNEWFLPADVLMDTIRELTVA